MDVWISGGPGGDQSYLNNNTNQPNQLNSTYLNSKCPSQLLTFVESSQRLRYPILLFFFYRKMFLNALRRMRCLCGDREISTEDIEQREPVMLNIYDLSTSNNYTFPLGLGVFHSGVQLYGREYAFLALNLSISGIFEIHPCNGQEELGEHFRFRKSILLGYTDFTCAEVKRVINLLGFEFRGTSYHLTSKNCNHFSNCLAHLVCGRKIPRWVNRLAYLITCVPFLERFVVSSPSHYPHFRQFQL